MHNSRCIVDSNFAAFDAIPNIVNVREHVSTKRHHLFIAEN